MKLSDLLEFKQIVIQCHDNPDADAIASGFAIYTYNINSSSCENHKDYSGCEIDNRKWYYLKDGK